MAKITTVGTSVMRVIDDASLPGSIKKGAIEALLQDGDLVDYALEELLTGIGVKAQRMYEYAKRGTYVHGLPSGQFTTGADGLGEVTVALESIEGAPVQPHYLHYGAPNNLHIGWLKLIASHGYNPVTNQLAGLTATKGTPVYLEDMVVVVPTGDVAQIEPSSLKLLGLAARAGYTPERSTATEEVRALVTPTPVFLETPGTVEYLRVHYGWMVGTTYTKDSFTIPMTGYDDNADYFHVRYSVGAVIKYWMYRDGAGSFPALDAVFDRDEEPSGSFFPFAYFRYEKNSEIEDKTTQAYLTSKKLVSYLGMNYDQVAEGIDANPDIADVEQAMLMMAVPANTTNELERRYLWKFFNNLFLASAPGTAFSSQQAADIHVNYETQNGIALERTPLTPGIVIQDARFKMSLENAGVYKRRVAGSIGPVGSHGSSFTVVSRLVEVDRIVGSGDSASIERGTVDMPTKSHFYRRQVSKGFYDEIQVVELRTRFFIIDGYTTLGDDTDNILIIPLDHSITKHYSVPDREILYARSLHYVFNSVVITKLAWYQTEIFQLVMIIAAVVIMIYTGVDTSQFLAFDALVAAGSYSAAASLVATLVLKYIVIQLVFKLFVKAVGAEAAFIIAIAALAAGAVQAFNAGSVAGAPWASELLALSNGLTQAIGAQLKADYADLLQEGTDFNLFKEAQTKLLDDANALLQNNTHVNPFVIFGETPQEFYNRTVHSGNIGVIGVNAISSYVDTVLTLPKLRDSIGDSV